MSAAVIPQSIAVLYLARGADADALARIAAFATSYRQWQAGIAHSLHVLYKGFRNAADLHRAAASFDDVDTHSIHLRDDAYDIGAYVAAAHRVDSDWICCLNTASVILADRWLLKLAGNLAAPGVGLVGCTGSYEAPHHAGRRPLAFPNVHLRSTGFLIDRRRFIDIAGCANFSRKQFAYDLEHGPDSMTVRVETAGLKVLVVGRDGRGYSRELWPASETFRQGVQANLLVGDNQTRDYEQVPIPQKRGLFRLAWGNGTTYQVAADTSQRPVTGLSPV